MLSFLPPSVQIPHSPRGWLSIWVGANVAGILFGLVTSSLFIGFFYGAWEAYHTVDFMLGPSWAAVLLSTFSLGLAGFIVGRVQRGALLQRSPLFSSWHYVTGVACLLGGLVVSVALNLVFRLADGPDIARRGVYIATWLTIPLPEAQLRLARVLAVSLFLSYPLFGVILGAGQSLVIRRVSSKSKLWVIMTMVLFAVAFLVITMVPGFSLTDFNYDKEVLLSYSAFVALTGISAGIIMPFILRGNSGRG